MFTNQFTQNGITLVFTGDDESKLSFFIKDDESLTEKLLSDCRQKTVRKKDLFFAKKSLFEKIDRIKAGKKEFEVVEEEGIEIVVFSEFKPRLVHGYDAYRLKNGKTFILELDEDLLEEESKLGKLYSIVFFIEGELKKSSRLYPKVDAFKEALEICK